MQKEKQYYWRLLKSWTLEEPTQGSGGGHVGASSPQQTQSLPHTQWWLRGNRKRNDFCCVLSPPCCIFPLVSLIGQTQLGAIRQREFRSNRPQGLEQHKEAWRMQLEWWKQKYQHIPYDLYMWLWSCIREKGRAHIFNFFSGVIGRMILKSQNSWGQGPGFVDFFFLTYQNLSPHLAHRRKSEMFGKLKADHRSTFINTHKCPGHALLISAEWVMNV